MPDMDDISNYALLANIQTVFEEIDPVPAGVVEAAKAGYAWRTIDAELAELAELVDDSALAPTAGIRGQGGPRLLTFEGPTVTVVVEVSEIGTHRRILGQLVNPQEADVEVRHADGSTTVPADDLGRFSVEGVPAGPVSFVCHTGSGQSVVTSWVTV
jgi:hypothetical protein